MTSKPGRKFGKSKRRQRLGEYWTEPGDISAAEIEAIYAASQASIAARRRVENREMPGAALGLGKWPC